MIEPRREKRKDHAPLRYDRRKISARVVGAIGEEREERGERWLDHS